MVLMVYCTKCSRNSSGRTECLLNVIYFTSPKFFFNNNIYQSILSIRASQVLPTMHLHKMCIKEHVLGSVKNPAFYKNRFKEKYCFPPGKPPIIGDQQETCSYHKVVYSLFGICHFITCKVKPKLIKTFPNSLIKWLWRYFMKQVCFILFFTGF